MTKEGDKKITLEYIENCKIHIKTIKSALDLQTPHEAKNRIEINEALCKIKEYALKITPFDTTFFPLLDVTNNEDKAFCSVYKNMFEDQKPIKNNEVLLPTPILPLTTFSNNTYPDNNFNPFFQFGSQENQIDNVLSNSLVTEHICPIYDFKKAENFRVFPKLINNLNLSNPFIVQNAKENNILKSYNDTTEATGLNYIPFNNNLFTLCGPLPQQNNQENSLINPYNLEIQDPLRDLDLRIPDFNSPTKYQQDIKEHWYSIFSQDSQRLERLNKLPIEKQQSYLAKKNLLINIINRDDPECYYTVDPRDMEKYTFKDGQLIVAIILPKEFYNIHAEAAISNNYKEKQGAGGKNSLLKEKKFYTDTFLELIAKNPNLSHGQITSNIWWKYKGKGNPLGGLTETSGRRTLNNWQNKVIKGKYKYLVTKK